MSKLENVILTIFVVCLMIATVDLTAFLTEVVIHHIERNCDE